MRFPLLGLVLLASLTGCGRLAFDSLSDGDGGAGSGDGQGGGAYCASLMPQPTFCDDFESRSLAGYSDMHENGGTIDVSSGELVISTQALATNSDSAAVYVSFEMGQVQQVTSSFDISAPVSGSGSPAALRLDMLSPDDHFVEYVHRLMPNPYIEESVKVGVAAPSYYFYQLPSLDAAKHHVSLDIVTGSMPTIRVAIDGVVGPRTGLAGTMGGQLFGYVGITFLAGPAAAWELHIDNLVVDVVN